MPNYAHDIEQAKQQAIDILKSNVDVMGTTAYDILLSEIEETFDISAGKIVADKDFIKKLNLLTISVLDLLQDAPKFSGPVSQFVRRFPKISDAINIFQSELNGITVPEFEVAKKIVIDETLDQMLGNGLNQNFVQPLRDLIYQNVTSGLTMKQAKQDILDYIQGGKDVSGKLGRYIEQTAIQATDAYSGIINTKILEQFDINTLLITGSLIETSSPQCRYAIEKLGGKITRENFKELEKIGKKYSGWIENTSFDNLPITTLHHGCRHGFFPYIDKKIAA